MKIYVQGQDYSCYIFENDTKYTKTYIYTNDGIYSYKKELQKIEIIEDIREKDYKNYQFFIDSSKINYTDIIYHIPYFHLFCEEETHKKCIGEGVYLVKNTYFDQTSYYFDTDRNDESLYDVIITFLSSN